MGSNVFMEGKYCRRNSSGSGLPVVGLMIVFLVMSWSGPTTLARPDFTRL